MQRSITQPLPQRLYSFSRFLQGGGGVWLAIALLYVVSALVTPAMLKVSQAFNILQVSAFLGVVALGQLIALLTGGIDLSLAGIVTLSNILVCSLMNGQAAQTAPAIALTLAICSIVGLLNGLVVSFLQVTPLIVTLATNFILFGAALLYTRGAPHGSAAPNFTWLGQGQLWRIPTSTIIWLIIAFGLAALLRYTVWGRNLYAVGANSHAAFLIGIRIRLTIASAYLASSLLGGVGGLLLTAYIGLPSLGIGDQFLLTAVAAPVVGGVALTGGIGTVLGVVGGSLFITLLGSFTNILGVSTGAQFIVQGAVIAVSVLFYRFVSNQLRTLA